MKFISLGKKRAHRQGRVDMPKPSQATVTRSIKPMAVPHQIHTYAELRQQIHEDLRTQHPEWIQPNGECPICDSYESRLRELLNPLVRSGSNESIVTPHAAVA